MPPTSRTAIAKFGSVILETLLHGAPIGFAFLDCDLRFVVVNDKLAAMNGLPVQAHLGRHVSEIVPALAAMVEEVTGHIARTGEPVLNREFSGETPATRGETRHWSESWYPVRDAEGALIGFGAVVEDITDRKRAEAALSAVEERRRKAMSIETVGLLFFTLDGRLTDANNAFQRMSGYSVEELRVLPHWSALTPPEYAEATRRTAHNLATAGVTPPYEKEMIRKDGSRWWGLFAPTRVAGEGGDSQCVEFIIDITHNKEIERALRDADRRKDQFLAVLAHELRNPLAPLKNGLHIIRLSSKADTPTQRTVELMDRQLNHLIRLVDDLLEVGRITSGKVELRRGRVGLSEVLANSIEACQTLMNEHRHRLTVEDNDAELFVSGDAHRLTQVFSNILCNAAKYTHDGGRITVVLRREESEALVEISDTGIGIPQSDLEHVFDIFSQVSEHQGRAEGGLGIGLALVRQLVALHGGSVTAGSRGLGMGSTFTVRLPLAEEAAPDAPSMPAPRVREGPPLKILVVEDNADVASSTVMLLELGGHEVHHAPNGYAALERAADVRFDVALVDIGMPGMDGIETARRLRESPNGRNVVFVALTGWGQEKDRQRTREAGFQHHLVKPFEPAQLMDILGELGKG